MKNLSSQLEKSKLIPLVESILDDDFVDQINTRAEKYVYHVSCVRKLESFIREYFEKLYHEQFINSRELRAKNNYHSVVNNPGNPGRDILVKDNYPIDRWIKDVKTFIKKLLSFARTIDKDLPELIDVDTYDDYEDVDIYINGFPDNGSFALAMLQHMEPGNNFFIWKKSDPKNGGVKLSLYSIDKCKSK